MDKIYFHEDDYCQIELLPKANYESCLKELGIISDFSDKHFDGIGYTDMYVRGERSIPTSTLNISLDQFSQFLLEQGLNKYTTVETGYSSYREQAESTWAFDRDNLTVFVNFEKNIVQNIWLDFYPNDTSKLDNAIHDLFFKLGVNWNLILVDWNLKKVINLNDKKSIESYWIDEDERIVIRYNEPVTNNQVKKPGNILQGLVSILTFLIPSANPSFEKKYKDVKYWWIEINPNNGRPERELGFDAIKRPIVSGPYKDNLGFWLDTEMRFNHKQYETIDIEIFNDTWRMFNNPNFKELENTIGKYLIRWEDSKKLPSPTFPIIAIDENNPEGLVVYSTPSEIMDNSDVFGYEWDDDENINVIDSKGNIYSIEYLNFGHPVGCVIPKKIEKVITINEFKSLALKIYKGSPEKISNKNSFFDLINQIALDFK